MEQAHVPWEHSLYFLSYAVTATFATIVMATAYYFRNKSEGAPINFNLLSMVGASALAMWLGVGLTEWIYVPRTFAAGMTAFFTGVSIALFVGWQLLRLSRKLERDRKTIQELATTDSLTGLLNPRVFHERLERELAQAVEFEEPLSLMFVDIVDLGEINDSYGYRGGDIVIREVGRRVAESARSADLVCRTSGDTIALILPKTDGASAEIFGRGLIRLLIDTPYDLGGWSSHVPIISVGIASLDNTIKKDRLMIKAAKKAADAAAAEGDNLIGRILPDGGTGISRADTVKGPGGDDEPSV